MKSAFTVLKLMGLLSVFVCGQAFGDVYLSCVDSKKGFQGDSFARLPTKDEFLATYTAEPGKNEPSKKILNFDNRLFLVGQQDKGLFLLAIADGDGGIFYGVEEAQDFCKDLEGLCRTTFADRKKVNEETPYRYAMGRPPSTSEFFSISVLYREGGKTKRFICPSPDQKR